MKILLVENHETFAAVVTEQFLAEHDVRIVASMFEARKILAHDSFEVLLVDYDLDDGKGAELVRELRSEGYAGRVYGVSSHEEGNAKIVAAGANGSLSKMNFHRIGALLASDQAID